MVNNQIEFNNTYSKEIKEIRIKKEDFTEKELVIENYPNLEKLYLREVESINKVILRNLVQLQKCTVSECGVQELVIENCSQIKELNIPDNSLASLEFVKDLEKLEKLELDGNAELVEILKSYKDDWKVYKKEIQKLIKLTKENPQKLLNIKEEKQELKERYNTLKKALASFSQEIQEQIKEKEIDEINSKIKTAIMPSMVTKDLLELTQTNVEKLKKWKEEKKNELRELKNKEIRLEEGLIKEKKEQLERLKKDFIEKRLVRFIDKREKIQSSLETYLVSIKDQTLYPNLQSVLIAGEEKKKYLLKGKAELTELLNELYEKQQEIISLETKSQSAEEPENQLSQIQIARVRRKSTSNKTLEYKDGSSEKQFGIQVDPSTKYFHIGVTLKKKDVTLSTYETKKQKSETIESARIGQKIIEKELGIQETEEQSYQVQIQQPPKQ